MSPEFPDQVAAVTAWIDQRPLSAELGRALEERFPPSGPEFQTLAAACRAGAAEGWLANRGEMPLKWGRVLKAGPQTHGFSVDVVHMTKVAGPRHAHPRGEIDMIIPLDDAAEFDGRGAGWLVYGPGSEHAPTVAGGAAIILYLLPRGEIDFSAG